VSALLHRLAVALLALLLASHVWAQGRVQVLDRADIVLSDAAEPPPDSAAWEPQTLPDSWRKTRPDASGYAWYRLRFELPSRPEETQAMMAKRLRTVGAVYVNGRAIGQTAEFGQEPSGLTDPVLYPFGPELLHAGENTLHVRLWVEAPRRGRVSGIRIGDKVVVVQAFERERFLFVTLTQMAAAFSLTIGIGTLPIWLQRRREQVFGYFSLAGVTTGLVIVSALGYLRWAPQPATDAAIWFALLALGTPALFIYCLRFAGWRWPRTERAVWLLAALIAVIDASPNLFGQPLFGVPLWEPLFALPCPLMLYVWYRRPGIESALLTLAHLYSTLSHLSVMWFGVGDAGGINIMQTHLMPLFLVMGWIITRRFAQSLTDAERLNAELEQRVEAKRAELASRAEQVQALTRQQALADERRRIMSDMHDGIGAQLISTLSIVEHGSASREQMAAALRDCIDDLRLAVDSLEPTDAELLPLLGNLRYRLEARLKASGIELDWQVSDVPKLACLTPQNVLHILRIVQEAFANVLKHAHASRIRVATAVDAGRVSISVSDDGTGFDGSASSRGYGLANMRGRARKIGGDLRIEPTASGTTLSLMLPIG
jgi:signal transduction histidine kinase